MKEKLVQMFHGSPEILIDWGNLKPKLKTNISEPGN